MFLWWRELGRGRRVYEMLKREMCGREKVGGTEGDERDGGVRGVE